MRHALQFLDGLIFPSQTMVSYFASRVFNGSHVASLVLPPLFGESFHPRHRLPECPHQPRLIFLGRMDWWDGQSTNNVLSIIDQLIQQKIHVFHSDKTGSFPHHPFRHTFAPMPMHELAAYSTQFDASLVVYETGACECDDRFRNTVPDRFLMSVAAGVPIAIPRDGYDACKEILRNYRAIFEYDSYGKLYDQLSDRGRVARMRAVACENRRLYDEDAYVFRMIDFLESLC